jgi:hypothetical protein
MNSCHFIINIMLMKRGAILIFHWGVRVANTTRCPMSRTLDDANIYDLPPDVITQPLRCTCLTKFVHFQMFVLFLCIWEVLVQIFHQRLCILISRSFIHSLQEILCIARCFELTHDKGKTIPVRGCGDPQGCETSRL